MAAVAVLASDGKNIFLSVAPTVAMVAMGAV
jgi:hypothetical protein